MEDLIEQRGLQIRVGNGHDTVVVDDYSIGKVLPVYVDRTSTMDYEYAGSFSVSQYNRIKSEPHLRHSLFASWFNGSAAFRSDEGKDWTQLNPQQRMVAVVFNNRAFIVVKDDTPATIKNTDKLFMGEPVRAMANTKDIRPLPTNVYHLFGHAEL